MKILITIPWFLPAYRAGGPIQSINNLVNTFTEGIEYKIFCSNTDLNGELLPNIIPGVWMPYNNHTEIWYAGKENLSNTLAKQTEILKPDVLYIIGLFNWHFNIVPLFFCNVPKKILSVRGMLHPGALSQKKIKKWIFLQLLKISGVTKKIIFHGTNETEERFIKNIFGKNINVLIAGNFSKSISPSTALLKIPCVLQMVTIAIISSMKNHLTVLNALMVCKANITYNIYGPIKDADYWKQCKKIISVLPSNITVNYYGDASPDQIENILSQNHIYIMPSKSENFGHAIAEALCAGKPVITSHATPWNGLDNNLAGFNVDITKVAIENAIEKFAAMDNVTYSTYVNGTIAYAAENMKAAENITAYKKLFFNI